jgi:hypothetical protein
MTSMLMFFAGWFAMGAIGALMAGIAHYRYSGKATTYADLGFLMLLAAIGPISIAVAAAFIAEDIIPKDFWRREIIKRRDRK